ncbi:MAG: high-affinity branched-chain amino acid ABC transporter permease LivM [Bdellovibrionales bacterium]
MMRARWKDAFLTAFVAFVLALPLVGIRTVDGIDGLAIEWRVVEVGIAAALIFFGRLLLSCIEDGYAAYVVPLAAMFGIAAAFLPMPSIFLQSLALLGAAVVAGRGIYALLRLSPDNETKRTGTAMSSVRALSKNFTLITIILILGMAVLPFTPLASRYVLDVAIMVLTYIVLASGLNITVGFAGLLDLGYVAFYAIGAYSYALLAQSAGMGFWAALPLAGILAAATGFMLGFPVLRLRGDYFAIVTLGFGEIMRLVLINWTVLTGGPNGISGIPRPALFDVEFAREAGEGMRLFSDVFGLPFDPAQRIIFLYYIILALTLAVALLSSRIRRLPLGRAWEAFREDEIACAAMGINRTRIKLAAYSMGAAIAGLAGAFFATRQGFISPESFTFTESATILAIVILGGVGNPLGIVLAAMFIIGMPELFRELEQYRMIAFGAGMVLIMIWRPGGLMAVREPTARLQPAAAKP